MLAEFIAALKTEKDKVAIEAITVRPGDDKDISFEYGHRQGVYAGLDRAIQLINRVVRDVETKTRDL
jgi:hypothetical protein